MTMSTMNMIMSTMSMTTIIKPALHCCAGLLCWLLIFESTQGSSAALAQQHIDAPSSVIHAGDDSLEDLTADTFTEEGEQFSQTSQNALPSLSLFNPLNSPFQQQNFVPNIALILDASVGGRSLDNRTYGELNQPLSLHQKDLHHAINSRNGFNFNYAELSLSAPVDPYIDLFTTFHLSPSEFEIEEAYFNTRALPWNLQLKGGKFLSHFGRLNPQHAHFWSFNDQPLINQAFLGNHGLNELGLRLNWLAPLDFYLDLGLEWLQGENTASFGTHGFSNGRYTLPEVNLPSLWVATAKSAVDLGEHLVLLGGLSYAQGGLRQDAAQRETGGHMHVHHSARPAFEQLAGGSQVLGLDLSLRWFIDAYRELNWQTEWLWRHLKGSHYAARGREALQLSQSGLYSQLIWRFDQQWRTGLRADIITQDERMPDAPFRARASTMLEYNPTEFTRFRLQYNLDHSRLLGESHPLLHEVFLQFNLAMGAHGAHEF